ncbi:MAG: universal stress protein [Myxococcales bacterium]|nr:universal stress protein [Myxococcales bacterium]
MRWVVGVDLRPGNDGPLQFAAWLMRQVGVGGVAVEGVHVLERDSLSFALTLAGGAEAEGLHFPGADGALASARDALAAALARVDVAATVRAEVTVAANIEEHLIGLVARAPGDGLVVGRRALRGEDHRFVRLGRVTRRLLRALPGPVVVVPPDLKAERIGDGPLLAATDLHDDSLPACRFAAELAARLGRKLVLVHVVPAPELWAPEFFPAARHAELRAALERRGAEALARWSEAHGLSAHEAIVTTGDVVDRLIFHAAEHDAPAVVCGSRRLSPVTRVFVASVASELAASAWRPVIVVPPASAKESSR